MVKCDKSPIAPASLEIEKAKGNSGSYRNDDVVKQLKTDFHDKCYICELKGLQDPEIEHLTPHKGNLDLKFDWNNLFWSCGHCNSIKNQRKYDGNIINCCQEDPEKHIKCEYKDRQVSITALDKEPTSRLTAELIYEVFNLKNTGMRINKSEYRFKALQKEMNIFYNELQNYEEHKTTMNKRRVMVRLKRDAAFAAFKRTYIRNNTKYAEFQDAVSL
ncbi:hypothetical protein [uncultured Megasphaera sp.]|uniref:hypothetical protein n=1 Tax=uncultured Megasphaera sp. TaxID=165188 RepID=UPI002627E831|nr:hypothetical protein [uncultured Megasphaera sp.]